MLLLELAPCEAHLGLTEYLICISSLNLSLTLVYVTLVDEKPTRHLDNIEEMDDNTDFVAVIFTNLMAKLDKLGHKYINQLLTNILRSKFVTIMET